MRYVPAACLREGMSIGKTILGKNSEHLLVYGTVLNQQLIASINRLNLPGVYIEDDISKDIEIVGVISDTLRIEAMKSIKKVFMKSQHSGLQQVKTKDIKMQIDSIIDELLENKNMMVNMIDLKSFDDYTYAHSVNVAILSIILGISMGLSRSNLSKLGLGAILHDIGKIFVNKDIINKPGKLTADEYAKIKEHPMAGYQYVKTKFELPVSSHQAIIDHHEKFDGSGYPNAKAGSNISVFGRIISIADVYDALSSERPYREAMNPGESMEYIMGNCGSSFDSDMVKSFIRKVAPYPVGTAVKLSNGYTGLVLENYESCCLRPKIRIIENQQQDIPPFEINLKDDYSLLNVVIEGIAKG